MPVRGRFSPATCGAGGVTAVPPEAGGGVVCAPPTWGTGVLRNGSAIPPPPPPEDPPPEPPVSLDDPPDDPPPPLPPLSPFSCSSSSSLATERVASSVSLSRLMFGSPDTVAMLTISSPGSAVISTVIVSVAGFRLGQRGLVKSAQHPLLSLGRKQDVPFPAEVPAAVVSGITVKKVAVI